MPRFTLQGHAEAGMRGTIAAEIMVIPLVHRAFCPFFFNDKRLESCNRRFPSKMTLICGTEGLTYNDLTRTPVFFLPKVFCV